MHFQASDILHEHVIVVVFCYYVVMCFEYVTSLWRYELATIFTVAVMKDAFSEPFWPKLSDCVVSANE